MKDTLYYTQGNSSFFFSLNVRKIRINKILGQHSVSSTKGKKRSKNYLCLFARKRKRRGSIESKGIADGARGRGKGGEEGRKGKGNERERDCGTGRAGAKYYDSTIHEWHHLILAYLNPTAFFYVIHISIIYK